MRFILIIAGLIIGVATLEGSRSFGGAFMGAAVCMFFGYLLRGSKGNSADADAIRSLREHVDRVTKEINQRLSALENAHARDAVAAHSSPSPKAQQAHSALPALTPPTLQPQAGRVDEEAREQSSTLSRLPRFAELAELTH